MVDRMIKGLTPLLSAAAKQDQQQPPPLLKQKRCGCCTRKLALVDFECDKCKIRFCGTHRLPEIHDCGHDFRVAGAAQLAAANPRVVADKVANRI